VQDQDHTITKYDRRYGNLHDSNAIRTKPSTIKAVENITGRSETFIVQTFRDDDGDHIFVECMDENGLTPIKLAPKVAAAIASQRDSLTARRRSIASKAVAKSRIDRGELPGFLRKKKKPGLA
jgi:hypothetical protein